MILDEEKGGQKSGNSNYIVGSFVNAMHILTRLVVLLFFEHPQQGKPNTRG